MELQLELVALLFPSNVCPTAFVKISTLLFFDKPMNAEIYAYMYYLKIVIT